MALLTIGQTPMPAPSKYKVSQYDIDSEGTKRNELGVLIRFRIRQGTFRVEVGWSALTDAQIESIGQAIEPESFSASFLALGSTKTKTMYAGDREMELVQHADMETKNLWQVNFALIEV